MIKHDSTRNEIILFESSIGSKKNIALKVKYSIFFFFLFLMGYKCYNMLYCCVDEHTI